LGFDRFYQLRVIVIPWSSPKSTISRDLREVYAKCVFQRKRKKTNTLEEETTNSSLGQRPFMEYVHEVLGGSLRDVNPELLVFFTASIGGRKTIARARQ